MDERGGPSGVGHDYWFHPRDPRDGVGPPPTSYRESVPVVARQGIVGDRFFGKVAGRTPLLTSGELRVGPAIVRVVGGLPECRTRGPVR